jgi:high-affinity Fe2+/Pb2+ permease
LGDFAATAMAIAMVAAFLLVIGGVRLLRQPENRRRGVLMLVAAAVLIGNVAILTV